MPISIDFGDEDLLAEKITSDMKAKQQKIAKIIADLNSETNYLVEMTAWAISSGEVTDKSLLTITAWFQKQRQNLIHEEGDAKAASEAIVSKWLAVQSCGNAENGAANLAQMIIDYGLDPATFIKRHYN